MAKSNVSRFFRKYQKVGLAALTLIAMIAFVFLPNIAPDHGAHVDRKTIATSKHGSLSQNDLETYRHNRRIVFNILWDLHEAVGQKLNGQGQSSPALVGFLIELDQVGLGNDAIADLWLESEYARSQGMVWSQETYRQTMQEWTQGVISDAVWTGLLRRVGNMTEKQFMSLLSTEMTAQQVRRMGLVSRAAAPMEQRFDWYSRTVRQVKIEAVELPVDAFTSRVAEPTSAELARFFDQYKDTLPNPNSDSPAFRVPRRFDVEYVKLPVDAFMVDPESVSDADALAWYEQNIGQFIDYDFGHSPLPGAPTEAETPDPTEPPPTENTPAEEKPTETALPEETAPVAELTPTPTEEKPTETALPEETAPVAERTPTPAEEKPTESEKPTMETSWDWGRNPFMTASMSMEESGEIAAPTTTEPAASEPAAPTAESAAPALTTVEPTTPTSTTTAELSAAETALLDGEEPTTVRYRPFDEVKEDIKRQIAAQRSQAAQQEMVEKIQDFFYEYTNERLNYEMAVAEAERNKTEAPAAPELLSLDTVTERFTSVGATAHRLNGFSMQDLADDGLDIAQDRGVFATWLFMGKVSPYEPYTTRDINENAYVFRVIADEPEHSVTLTDEGVRDTVLAAWKQFKARDLAMEEAGKLMAQVRSEEGSLQSTLTDHEVITPLPFSWLTQQRYGTPPVLSPVIGIDKVGDGFMRSVFSLKAGETGTAWNQTKTALYMVHIVEYPQSEDLLRSLFQYTPLQSYYLNGDSDQQQQLIAWEQAFRKDRGFVWDARPDEYTERLVDGRRRGD